MWMSSLAALYIRSGALAPPDADPPDGVPVLGRGVVGSFIACTLRLQSDARLSASGVRGQDARRCGLRRQLVDRRPRAAYEAGEHWSIERQLDEGRHGFAGTDVQDLARGEY